jgi:TonB family protein
MYRLDEGSLVSPNTPIPPNSELRQRRRMLVALAVLLLALILVVIRNREFFYPSAPVSDPDAMTQEGQPQTNPVTMSGNAKPLAPSAKSRSGKTNAHISANSKSKAEAQEPPAVATAERAVLPALQVEVVAGDTHRTVHPGNNAIKVDMQPGTPVDQLPADSDVARSSPAVDASERVRMSADASQLVAHQVTPNYPLLAKQMKVQGAVILQALIGKEGKIQDLQVLSGPSILSSAAREAVKQWRFKPYLQSGEPVETQARITVNFTISTY